MVRRPDPARRSRLAARRRRADHRRKGQGLCQRCNHVKDLPGWQSRVLHTGPIGTSDDSGTPHTVQVTTPTGHRHTSTAPTVLPGHENLDEAAALDQLRRETLTEHGIKIHRIAA